MLLVKPSCEIMSNPTNMLEIIERAGRVCYKSEDKITSDSAVKFVKGIINRGHESVIEHASVTVKFVVDRGVSHELVRHRLASYSQESTRYCNYGGGVTFVIPFWLAFNGMLEPGEVDSSLILENWKDYLDDTLNLWLLSMARAEREYIDLLSMGWSPQQARSVLPNSLKTEIVMTANVREWRHIFKLRCAPRAHPQMQEIMRPLLDEFRKLVPVLFEEILTCPK